MRNAPLELVVAASENDVIGRANALPWRLPADLRHFKALTLGGGVLMGRRTYESIGRALPDRLNLVLSRSSEFARPGATLVHSLDEALARMAQGQGQGQRQQSESASLMVIGGAEVYRLCLPRARRIHLTLVHASIDDGDTFFNEWRRPEWHEVGRERHEADERHVYAYSFVTLERKR